MSTLRVDIVPILREEWRHCEKGLEFVVGQYVHAGLGRKNHRTDNRRRESFFGQHRYECLSRSECRDFFFEIVIRRYREVFHGFFDGFVVFCRKSSKCVLNLDAELCENPFGNVRRILRTEEYSHPLRANKLDDCFELFEKFLGNVAKQEVCLVDEEDKFWFFEISYLREFLKHLGEYRYHECHENLRIPECLCEANDIDSSFSVFSYPHEILHLE